MTYSLIPYIFLFLGLLAALALFLSIKRELHTAAAKNRKQLEELVSRIQESHTTPEPIYVPVVPGSGMNLNKRVQAVRMLRRSEDPSYIAAALGMARSEVELLIRIQRLCSEFAA